jgi:hypothetical protein
VRSLNRRRRSFRAAGVVTPGWRRFARSTGVIAAGWRFARPTGMIATRGRLSRPAWVIATRGRLSRPAWVITARRRRLVVMRRRWRRFVTFRRRRRRWRSGGHIARATGHHGSAVDAVVGIERAADACSGTVPRARAFGVSGPQRGARGVARIVSAPVPHRGSRRRVVVAHGEEMPIGKCAFGIGGIGRWT